MYKNLFIDILEEAAVNHNAVGAVNIFNHITAESAMYAANDIKQNIIIQTSSDTVKRLGANNLFHMVDSIRKGVAVKVALHLDHCRDDKIARSCIEAGWDGVMMDYSHLSLKENIYYTKCMAEIAHSNNVAVEGEVGVISGVEDDIISSTASGAKYDETMEFMERTNIDAIAPSIGTAHGVYHGVPELNYELVEALGKQAIPIVIHGGTGLLADSFIKLIRLGARKVNISTLVKNAYMDTIAELVKSSQNYTPIAFDDMLKKALLNAVKGHLMVFAGMSEKFSVL